jgi:hypothetical protein
MKGSMIRVNTLLVFLLMTGPVCALSYAADERETEEKSNSIGEDLPEVPSDAKPKSETTAEAKAEDPRTDDQPPVTEPAPVAENTAFPSNIWNEPMPMAKEVTPEPPPIAKDYEVRQQGNNLELITPYGRKLIFGDYGFQNQHDYKFSIPLDQLRPPGEKPIPLKAFEKTDERQIASVPPNETKPTAPIASGTPGEMVPPRVIVEYDYSDRLILEANRLYNRRKFYEASITIEELLTKRPDYPRGWVMKGSLMYVQGQRDLAKEAWKKALELDPNNLQVKQYLGRLK